MVNNRDFLKFYNNDSWWKVDSFTEYDDHTIAIELKRMQVIDQLAPITEDGFPPRKVVRRYRLYRLSSTSVIFPANEVSTETFARRCKAESEQIGYPVMVTWWDEETSFHPLDWFSPIDFNGHLLFIRAWNKRIFDTVQAFALAFNRTHIGAWEGLLKDNHWLYNDGDFSYAHNYGGEGVPDRLDLSLRLVQLHHALGDVTAGLCKQEGQVYVPAVINKETQKGFVFQAPSENNIKITTMEISNDSPFIPFQEPYGMEKLIPQTVYGIEGWEIHSNDELEIDVDIATIITGKPSTRERYRLSIARARKRLGNEDTSILIFQSLDKRRSEEEREEKMDLVYDRDKVDRLWTEKILNNPWINVYGHLEFLNGATFAPSWIVKMGTLVTDPGS